MIHKIQITRVIDSHVTFTVFILIMFLFAGVIYPVKIMAAWFGFVVSAYSVIANDSLQTIGTFLASNRECKWWILWIYISTIFFVTLLFSWLTYDGDISHQRLLAKGFEDAPSQFVYLQIAAPIILLVLTHIKMPVSTSFLVLGSFVGSGVALNNMIMKSLSGYLLAFVSSFIVFILIAKWSKRCFVGQPSKIWYFTQWTTSGLLWSIWLQQDLANIAIFLPRSLNTGEFSLIAGFIILELSVLLFFRGGRIQEVVVEKTDVSDPRFATMIDGVYAIVLGYFRMINRIPMSTTWVFLGLLAGRELAIWLRGTSAFDFSRVRYLIGKDALKALIGFMISILVAFSVNPYIKPTLLING
ncbi:MAG: hypothetical protein CMF42_00215 [Legionellales bacterium]|nr:hypothetical protein [Legionellales bacterium]